MKKSEYSKISSFAARLGKVVPRAEFISWGYYDEIYYLNEAYPKLNLIKAHDE